MPEAPAAPIKSPEPIQKPLESRFASVVQSLPRRLAMSDTVPLETAVATATDQLSLSLQHRLIQDNPLEPINPITAKKLDVRSILENDKAHKEMVRIAELVQVSPELWQNVDLKIEELRNMMVELYKGGHPGAQIMLDDEPLIALLMALEPKNRDAYYYDVDGDGLKHIILDSTVARTVFECFPKLFQSSEEGVGEATA